MHRVDGVELRHRGAGRNCCTAAPPCGGQGSVSDALRVHHFSMSILDCILLAYRRQLPGAWGPCLIFTQLLETIEAAKTACTGDHHDGDSDGHLQQGWRGQGVELEAGLVRQCVQNEGARARTVSAKTHIKMMSGIVIFFLPSFPSCGDEAFGPACSAGLPLAGFPFELLAPLSLLG